jgi:hypothetical protein
MVPDDWSASHPGWIEGNVVLTPTNDIYNILRVSTSVAVDEPVIDKAAIHKFDSETSTLSFNPDKGFIDFPGGNHKFTIRRDPVTGAYLSLVNNNTDPNESRQRNILSLSWSQDLVHWKLIETLIEDDLPVSWEESLSQTGFQYVDWQFDGDDIIYVSRTSYDGAHNYHDANRLTFDRIENYASRIPIPGDFNGDREVNFKDFAQISSSLMASEGEQGWDKKYNFAEPHDEIDMVDFSVFAENWLLSGY